MQDKITSTYPKVYIILVNYNGWQDTIVCLESNFKSDYNNYQVIIVDNGSKDDSVNKIKLWAQGEIFAEIESEDLKDTTFPFCQKPIPYIFYEENDLLDKEAIMNEPKVPLIIIKANDNTGFSGGNNIAIKYALNKNLYSSQKCNPF